MRRTPEGFFDLPSLFLKASFIPPGNGPPEVPGPALPGGIRYIYTPLE
jgi:hypothetical protein